MQNFVHTSSRLFSAIIKICFWWECSIWGLIVYGHNEQHVYLKKENLNPEWNEILKELNKIFAARIGFDFLKFKFPSEPIHRWITRGGNDVEKGKCTVELEMWSCDV